MGAGGSTAASCSSLDLTNGQTAANRYRHYRQNNCHQYLHEHKVERLKRHAAGGLGQSGYLKRSSSHFDLMTRDGNENPYLDQNERIPHGFNDMPTESYHLTNADVSRPVRVQPSKPIITSPPPAIHLSGGAKKSNAGVASRILHQRQQSSNDLKRFSDSMPSLNNMLCPQTRHELGAIGVHQLHQKQQVNPIHRQRVLKIPRESSPDKQCHQSRRASAIQAKQHQQQLMTSRQKVSTANLVENTNSNYKDIMPSYHRYKQAQCIIDDNHQSVMLRQQLLSQKQQHRDQQKLSGLTRATSLSSLHNLNQSHHHNQHQLPPDKNLHRLDMLNLASSPLVFAQNRNNISKPSNGLRCHNDTRKLETRPSSLVSNGTSEVSAPHYPRVLSQQQQIINRHSGCDFGVKPNNLHSHQYRLPPQAPQQQHAMFRKNHKYRQSPSVSGQASKNNRYKSKLQQQQHQATQQQGCPVLPPLPRSQSLHELIQLRATENGQRMRTTGTLRGPFGNNDQSGGKVNMVAELLESRRQQRRQVQGDDQQTKATDQNSETLLSQSSSSDDGIHDVSVHGDGQHSTGSSRTKNFVPSKNRSPSSSSQDCDARTKQRAFKKQSAGGAIRFASKGQVAEDQEKVDDHSSIQPHQHKSTLKRSTSHTALHSKNSFDQDGGNESDDLNELARFLYQFNQRQSKTKSTDTDNNHHQDVPYVEHHATSSNNLQQSPNSTTSSSGFASSTCTSHSISTSIASSQNSNNEKIRDHREISSSRSHKEAGLQPVSRKKYPAPPRPDDAKLSSTSNLSNSKSFSSKLKLSSSLLSIVNEYQSTLQGKDQLSSQVLLSASNLNLASVSRYGKDSDQFGGSESRKPRAGDSSGCRNEARSYKNTIDQQLSKQQLDHYEHLRKYTQMRQMSQSELALNHLTSSTTLDPTGSCSSSHYKNDVAQLKSSKCENLQTSAESNRTNKPYTNRLFNLIRRISDKSESAKGRASSLSDRDSCKRATEKNHSCESGSGRGFAVGGQYLDESCQVNSPDAINQNASGRYSNRCGQLELLDSVNSQAGNVKSAKTGVTSPVEGGYAGISSFSNRRNLGTGHAVSGESLRDLNFDCDFELIKNCRSANESALNGLNELRKSSKALSSATSNERPGQTPSLLFASTAKNELGGRQMNGNDSGEKKSNKRNKTLGNGLITNPSQEHNNWRLAPTSSLMGLTTSANSCEEICGKDLHCNRQQQCSTSYNNYNNKRQAQPTAVAGDECKTKSPGCMGGDGLRDVHGVKNEDKLQPCQSKQHQKSKWSASSWLLGGSSEKKNSQKKGTTAAESHSSNNSKSYLAKLIPSSGTSAAAAAASGSRSKQSKQKDGCDEAARRCDMISEADQLLVELDQSLDLVSSADQQPRLRATAWWQQSAPGEINGLNGARTSSIRDQLYDFPGHHQEPGDLLSDSDNGELDNDDDLDNNDADYASINRALINETFDIDSNALRMKNGKLVTVEPGSPSDSFTFSAPSSPTFSASKDRGSSKDNNKRENSEFEKNAHLEIERSRKCPPEGQQSRGSLRDEHQSNFQPGGSAKEVQDPIAITAASLTNCAGGEICDGLAWRREGDADKRVLNRLQQGSSRPIGAHQDDDSTKAWTEVNGAGTKLQLNDSKIEPATTTSLSTYNRNHLEGLTSSTGQFRNSNKDTNDSFVNSACLSSNSSARHLDHCSSNEDNRMSPDPCRNRRIDGPIFVSKQCKNNTAAIDVSKSISGATTSANNLTRIVSSGTKPSQNNNDDYEQLAGANEKKTEGSNGIADSEDQCAANGCCRSDTGVKCQSSAAGASTKSKSSQAGMLALESSKLHSLCSIHGQSSCCADCFDHSPTPKNDSHNIVLDSRLSAFLNPKRQKQQQHHPKQFDTDKAACCNGSAKPLRVCKPMEGKDAGGRSCCNDHNPTVRNGQFNMEAQNNLERVSHVAAAQHIRTTNGLKDSSVISNHRPSHSQDDRLITQRDGYCQCCCSSNSSVNEASARRKQAMVDKLSNSHHIPSAFSVNCSPEGKSSGYVRCCKPSTTSGGVPTSKSTLDGRLVTTDKIAQSSPKVTYYHYSHETGNFALTTNSHHSRPDVFVKDRESQCSSQDRSKALASSNDDTPAACSHRYNLEPSKNDSSMLNGACPRSQACKTACHDYEQAESSSSHRSQRHCQSGHVDCLNDGDVGCGSGGSDSGSRNLANNSRMVERRAVCRRPNEAGQLMNLQMADCCGSSRVDNCSSCSSSLLHQSENHKVSDANQLMDNQKNFGSQVAACLAKFQPPHSPNKTTDELRSTSTICRSNSELLEVHPHNQQQAVARFNSKQARPYESQEKKVGNLLFGKLRNSLLNQRGAADIALPKYLASSQVSLVNYYTDQGALHLPPSARLAGTATKSSHKLSLKNDFDENFILRRKTPNAGLRVGE